MIYWLHDFRLGEYLGGAQLTTKLLVESSPYEVEMVYPDTFSREKINGHPLIISNCGRFRWDDLLWIADTQSYIKHERDIAFCKHRHALDHDCKVECKDSIRVYNTLFSNAQYNIFLSPLQMNFFKNYIDIGEATALPVPIEVDRFKYDGPKEDFYLAVHADDSYHKGSDIVRQKFPNITFIGGANKVPYDEIHTYFKRAKYFVHMPRVIEAFCRAVAEAYCASCNLITNDKIGFLSYDWDYEDREFVLNKLSTADKQFWGKVKEVFYEG